MPSVKVCDLELIQENTIKSFSVEGQEIMVIKVKGEISCLQARCTHAGAPLSEGTIDENILTCPWHGSKFRITDGQVVKGPAKQNLKVFNCIVRNESLFAEV